MNHIVDQPLPLRKRLVGIARRFWIEDRCDWGDLFGLRAILAEHRARMACRYWANRPTARCESFAINALLAQRGVLTLSAPGFGQRIRRQDFLLRALHGFKRARMPNNNHGACLVSIGQES